MHTNYPNINFVRPDDLGYKKWCHRNAQIRKLSSRNSKHDPFEFAFNKQLKPNLFFAIILASVYFAS